MEKNDRNPRTAVLLIHGILGTPKYFDFLLPLLPADWTVQGLLLKGHGGSVKDFSAASMAEWKQQVKDALDSLRKSNDKILIVAHSMGTLFAIQQAVNQPVDALFLLNVPLKVRLKFRLFPTCIRILCGRVDPNDGWAVAARDSYGMEQDPHLWRYLGWIPRYLELFSEIRKTKKLLCKLTGESDGRFRAYFSTGDELVSPKSGDLMTQRSPAVCVRELRDSGHFYYAPADRQTVIEDFCDIVQRLQTQENPEK